MTPRYQELQNKDEYNLVTKTVDYEVYRTRDSMFIIFDLVTGDSLSLEFDDVPQLFDIMKQLVEVQKDDVDWTLLEKAQ